MIRFNDRHNGFVPDLLRRFADFIKRKLNEKRRYGHNNP
jgi:hypothetical protein